MTEPFSQVGYWDEILVGLRARMALYQAAAVEAERCRRPMQRWFIAAGVVFVAFSLMGSPLFFTLPGLLGRLVVLLVSLACLLPAFSWLRKRRASFDACIRPGRLGLAEHLAEALCPLIPQYADCRFDVSFAPFDQHGQLEKEETIEQPTTITLRSYRDPWLTLQCPLVDGGTLELQITQHARVSEIPAYRSIRHSNSMKGDPARSLRTYEEITLMLTGSPAHTTCAPMIGNLRITQVLAEGGQLMVTAESLAYLRGYVNRLLPQAELLSPTGALPAQWEDETKPGRDRLSSKTLLRLLSAFIPALRTERDEDDGMEVARRERGVRMPDESLPLPSELARIYARKPPE